MSNSVKRVLRVCSLIDVLIVSVISIKCFNNQNGILQTKIALNEGHSTHSIEALLTLILRKTLKGVVKISIEFILSMELHNNSTIHTLSLSIIYP